MRDQVERDGGQLISGWSLWNIAGFVLEAEHHAVHLPEGKKRLSDITPSHDPSDKYRVFVRDDDAHFDLKRQKGLLSERVPILDNPLTEEFISVLHERDKFRCKFPSIGEILLEGADARRWSELNMKQRDIELKLLAAIR